MPDENAHQKTGQMNDEFIREYYPDFERTDKPQQVDLSYEPQRMMTFEEIRQLDEKYLLQNYARMPVAFAYGSGEFLYDTEGREYIDFLSGIAVTALGHAQADLINAIHHQADLVWHTSNLFYNQQQAMLARALVEINFPGRVFLCNSGTEANEAALKLMRVHGQARKATKYKIISLIDSFHGRTFGAMTLTGQEKIHGGFGPLLPGVVYVPANDISALEAAVDEDVCGIIIEPIQGEGGVLPMETAFLQKARELCDRYDALLCFDEVQTGMGRTGAYFAYQNYGVLPDILTMAKGLGGGFPIGAMLVAEKFAPELASGMHGSTFGGNHLGSAVAYEVIRFIEAHDTLNQVKKSAAYFRAGLQKLQAQFPDIVREVRGMGLLVGLVLRDDIEARPLVGKALEERLVIGRAGHNVLRFAPPLIVREQTIDRALERLARLLATL